MNLRINGQEIRFRVTKEELKQICSGTTVESHTSLPGGKALNAQVVPTSTADAMHVEHVGNCISLHVGVKDAIDFYNRLPTREGIEVQQNIDANTVLTAMLEVDIRTQKRSRGSNA